MRKALMENLKNPDGVKSKNIKKDTDFDLPPESEVFLKKGMDILNRPGNEKALSVANKLFKDTKPEGKETL